jgi:cobalt/nickel transport system ATP-binding protein
MSLLEIDNLSYRYHDGAAALRGATLHVAEGERLALVGPNGAGKSTLLLAVLGFLEARGRVAVAGLELTRASAREIRRRVGIVFQNADDQLFMPTVFDDVAFGPLCLGLDAPEVRRRVAEALEQVGAADLADRAPYHLSGGEKRRVALATVLAMRPRAILFDEPSSSLDQAARRRLMTLLASMPGTQVIATHDLELVRAVCTRVAVMAEGRMVADGPTTQLLDDTDLLHRYGLTC